jgi:hypothetical protein
MADAETAASAAAEGDASAAASVAAVSWRWDASTLRRSGRVRRGYRLPLLRRCHEQGVAARRLDVDQLFVPETREKFKI